MAVKWAVANGNWSAGATWNGGIVPTIGDEVYLNNHTITANVNINIGNGTIRNGVNSDYGIVAGGTLTIGTRRNIIANLLQESGVLINMTTRYYDDGLMIVGNVKNTNDYLITCADVYDYHLFGVIINGNLEVNARFINSTFGITGYEMKHFQVVGNVTINGEYAIYMTYGRPFPIVKLDIIGILTTNGNGRTICQEFNINGHIFYNSKNVGLAFFEINILNPDTFTWEDVAQPSPNPFIILTDAEMNNRQQYPTEDEVKEGTEYVWGEKVGTYKQPPESVVLKDFVYDNGDKVGSLENENIVGCVNPEDVRKDVPLVGMGVVGSLVVPSVDDVREGVVFDNGSVGTLIVEGGGDRLRIADFGYYTNAQSDTYIVDLTEQDKPKFAVAEERVLIEMFPELDLENIPEKYFDDLFVKYLKYRLIVEYYRTAGINSTFSTSEPTTEIVNYRNVNCEIWMNIANTYLKAWGEKYPNSIKKQRILL